MFGLKKLDRYILSKFLLIFVGAFFICLFVFMMQFTWRYVDELIGKGLSMEILGQFFWYMSLTLVPQALPLSVLLASLITFGNLGESLELLAMKAAGVSLIRIMRPLAIIAFVMMGVSFYFQNRTSPQAQINLSTLLFSMKQQSPAVEIPEGVFYNGVPNINLYVQKKDTKTGMLYQTIIYKTDQGFDRAQIVLADSARLEMTRDKMHLKLDLWHGELFESLQGSNSSMMQSSGEQPYDRETFIYKQLLIDFDSNFNLMDKNLLSNMPAAKDMRQIGHTVDSVDRSLDSVGHRYYTEATDRYFNRPALSGSDSLRLMQTEKRLGKRLNIDSIANTLPSDNLQQAQQITKNSVQSMKSDLEWKSLTTADGDNYIRLNWVEWHKKMTFSLACLLFFFIGAPLGAIIRKGGLGMPTVISVAIFIFWYIINTSGTKMARDGSVDMVLGMWACIAIIAPFGLFITYKANHDSVVFNIDAYKNLLIRLLGLRTKRHLYIKEVIIEDPRTDTMPAKLEELAAACRAYNASHKLLHAPGYAGTFFRYRPDTAVIKIHRQLESIIEELSNSRDPKVIGLLNQYPVLYTTAHTSPFHSRRLNTAAGIFFPVGLVLWLRIWRFRLHLLSDLKSIVRASGHLQQLLQGHPDEYRETEEEHAEEEARARRKKRNRRILKVLIVLIVAALLGNIGWNGWKRYSRQRAAQQTERAYDPTQRTNQNRLPASTGTQRPSQAN